GRRRHEGGLRQGGGSAKGAGQRAAAGGEPAARGAGAPPRRAGPGGADGADGPAQVGARQKLEGGGPEGADRRQPGVADGAAEAPGGRAEDLPADRGRARQEGVRLGGRPAPRGGARAQDAGEAPAVRDRGRKAVGEEMVKQAAGTLLYRTGSDGLEVLLVHPSGWYNKKAPWSIPKGIPNKGETDLEATA